MTKYREILRLTALGLSQRSIIRSINVSQKTIVKVQRRAQELKLSWPLDDSLTDDALDKVILSIFLYTFFSRMFDLCSLL